MREKLLDFSTGDEPLGLFKRLVSSSPNLNKIAFLFTGQGSQYINMGHQLYETQPIFHASLDLCDQILRLYLEKPLLSVLYPEPGEPSPLDETAYTQPALFALEYALVQLWKSWGIKPTAVMGHSVGEYVAACVAGVFSLEDGIKLISERARLMQKLPQHGQMRAVFANIAEIRAVAEFDEQKLAIAAVNGPRNTVISGETQAVQRLCSILESAGIKTKKLQTSHAFHSHLMEPILAEFYEIATTITYAAPQINLISNLTGERLSPETFFPEYWCRHLRSSVQFADSLNTLYASGYEAFVEIGPKPTLLGMGRSCLPEKEAVWLPSLRQGQSDWQQMLQSLGELYVRGVEVDWSGFDRDYGRRRVVLPTYPFQRQRYWVEKAESKRQHTQALLQEQIETSVVNLLHQGNAKQLAQLLHGSGNFSQEEMKVLPKLIEALVNQHQKERQLSAIKGWLHQVEWQLRPQQMHNALEKTQAREPGSWVVFADYGGMGQALAELLQQRGQNCILVQPGQAYQALETSSWSIDPTNPGDFERLFQEVVVGSIPPLRGIIHLWSLESVSDGLTTSALDQAQEIGCGSVLRLVQTLVKLCSSASPRLWLVTRGAMAVEEYVPVAVAQAPLWGLGKVIALEHPELWGGMLDLAPCAVETLQVAPIDEATKLLAEIEDSSGEDNLAFRNGNSYVARLVPRQLPESKKVVIRSDGTYLITGGLGALGLLVAQWMVSQGARQLVLTGRGSISNEAQLILKQLQQKGAKVLVQKADVSHEADMIKVLEAVAGTMSPLRGVVHAAGVLDDGILQQHSWERFSTVMAPKVRGAWNLHALTQGLGLDFFVLFSSVAALLGSPGQGNYAAANSFMDALAHYRYSRGLPGLSINWGPWAAVGMAASLASRHSNANATLGLDDIAPDQGLLILEQMLGQATSQIGVLPIDWSVLKQQLSMSGQLPPLLSELFAKIDTHQEETDLVSVQRSDILPRLSQAQSGDRLNLLVAYLQEQIIRVLGFDESLISNPHQGLIELGFDSLMAVQLKNAIATDLKLNIPLETFIGGSGIMQLAEFLIKELVIVNATLSVPPSSPSENDLEVIKPPIEVRSTPFASVASAATSNQDNWIEGEL